MRSSVNFLFLALFVAAFHSDGVRAQNDFDGPVSGPEAWQTLLAGNARFVNDTSLGLNVTQARRESLFGGQDPGAIVLTCADSRVPPELLFNMGLGDLFVVRVAGNVMTPELLGSIDYAVEHLRTKLVVVLGHQKCGAVSSALSEYINHLSTSGDAMLDSTLAPIFPAVKMAVDKYGADSSQTLNYAVQENALLACNSMVTNSKAVQTAMSEDPDFLIVVAEYLLSNGSISVLGNSSTCVNDPAYKFADKTIGVVGGPSQQGLVIGLAAGLGTACFVLAIALAITCFRLRRANGARFEKVGREPLMA